VHVGSFIAKGGGGTINKVWDLGRNQINVMKRTRDNVSADRVRKGKAPTDVEAKNLRKINPKGEKGVQRAPYAVFRVVSKGVTQAGFLTHRYDGDLSSHLSSIDEAGNANDRQVSFTTPQLVSAGRQIFSGVTLLDQKNVSDPDIKCANLFVRMCEDNSYEFHIADFDQARFMDDSLFTSEEFQKDPVGGSSSDSISYEAHQWLSLTGKAIVDLQNILKLTPREKKENLSQLREQREMLQQKLGEAKDDNAKKKLEASLRKYDSVIRLLETPDEQLQQQLGSMKDNYRNIVRNIHVASAGHLLYQMLDGDVNPRIGKADFNQLKKK